MVQKKTAQFLIAILCSAILLFGVFVRPKLFSPPEKKDRPDYLFEGMQLREFVKGVKTMEISAATASFDRDKELLTMKDLDALFFVTGYPPVHLRSPDAGLELTTGAISLYHPNITMVLSEMPMQIRSNQAIWESKAGLLRASGNVHVSRNGLTVSSESLRLRQTTGLVEFFGRAKAQWVF
jgi:LPS export ABC transporter protein LptC